MSKREEGTDFYAMGAEIDSNVSAIMNGTTVFPHMAKAAARDRVRQILARHGMEASKIEIDPDGEGGYEAHITVDLTNCRPRGPRINESHPEEPPFFKFRPEKDFSDEPPKPYVARVGETITIKNGPSTVVNITPHELTDEEKKFISKTAEDMLRGASKRMTSDWLMSMLGGPAPEPSTLKAEDFYRSMGFAPYHCPIFGPSPEDQEKEVEPMNRHVATAISSMEAREYRDSQREDPEEGAYSLSQQIDKARAEYDRVRKARADFQTEFKRIDKQYAELQDEAYSILSNLYDALAIERFKAL